MSSLVEELGESQTLHLGKLNSKRLHQDALLEC